MFVPWLELTALGGDAERDINDLAVPFAHSDEDGVFCWHPKTDGSLVICKHADRVVEANALGGAIADHAASLGVDVLRPEWEGTDPTAEQVEAWVNEIWQLCRDRRGLVRRAKPLVVLLPHYDATAPLAEQGFYFAQVHDRMGELVKNGPRFNVFPIVTYTNVEDVWPLSFPDFGTNNLYSRRSTVLTLGFDGADAFNEVLLTPASEYVKAEQEYVVLDLLPLDQVVLGLRDDERGER